MSYVQKAGAIIVRRGSHEPEVLLVYRGGHNDWSFPKGHCEGTETHEETALREAREETGLTVRIIRRLPDMVYMTKLEGEAFVAMYLATPIDEHEQERIEREGDRLEWIPISRVASALSYVNLQEYFRSLQQPVY